MPFSSYCNGAVNLRRPPLYPALPAPARHSTLSPRPDLPVDEHFAAARRRRDGYPDPIADGKKSRPAELPTERVSVASDGTEANGFSSVDPSISADGRFVAYCSAASNLVPGDTNGADDIFVFDRQTNTTERVSVASDGTEGNGFSVDSRDFGGWPLCDLRQRCLEPGPRRHQRHPDIFVFDRQTDTTDARLRRQRRHRSERQQLQSLDFGGWPLCGLPSAASNLVPGDTNGFEDVFVVQTDVAPPVDGVVKDGDDGNNVLKGTRRDDILRGHGGKDWLFGNKGDDSLDGGRATTRYLPAKATIPCLAAQAMTGFGPARAPIWLSSTKAMAMTGSSTSTSVVTR